MPLSIAARNEPSSYLPCLFAMLAGSILLLSSALVLSGLLIFLVIGILLLNGFSKILVGWREPASRRLPGILNGLIDLGCAALLWYLSRLIGPGRATGVIIGAQSRRRAGANADVLAEAQPQVATAGTGRPPRYAASLRSERDVCPLARPGSERIPNGACSRLMWMATLGGVFRRSMRPMPIADSILGVVSPLVATAGDLLMTLVFAMLLILPARLLWRRLDAADRASGVVAAFGRKTGRGDR